MSELRSPSSVTMPLQAQAWQESDDPEEVNQAFYLIYHLGLTDLGKYRCAATSCRVEDVLPCQFIG
jgi:hypothetical protein